MATANVQQSLRQLEKMRDEMIRLRSMLSARLRQASAQDDSSQRQGAAVALQLKSPDEKKADIREELVKLKLSILDVKVMSEPSCC